MAHLSAIQISFFWLKTCQPVNLSRTCQEPVETCHIQMMAIWSGVKRVSHFAQIARSLSRLLFKMTDRIPTLCTYAPLRIVFIATPFFCFFALLFMSLRIYLEPQRGNYSLLLLLLLLLLLINVLSCRFELCLMSPCFPMLCFTLPCLALPCAADTEAYTLYSVLCTLYSVQYMCIGEFCELKRATAAHPRLRNLYQKVPGAWSLEPGAGLV